MVAEIAANAVRTLRVHVAGDFWSAAYAKAWLAIARRCPDTRFFVFTRSWRVPAIRPVLEELARLPNVRLFWSLDAATGLPGRVPPQVRLAYMALDEDDLPPLDADLVFVDAPLRRERRVRMAGVLVCPMENGTGWHGTCEKCRLCIDPLGEKDPRTRKRRFEWAAAHRVPLSLVG
jgi:hypothetical protein